MAPKLGQEAILNGQPVRWGGDDYGWQSTASYKKADKDGQFKLGSSLARRAAQAFEQADQLRHNIFGTADEPVEGTIAHRLKNLIENNPLSSGEDIAMNAAGNIASRLGISPALGALALGTVLPGPGEGKAVSRFGNYTSPAKRAAIKARAGRTPTTRVGPNSQWDSVLTPEQKQLTQADAVKGSQRAVRRNNEAIADVLNPDSPAARIRAHIGDRPNRRVPKDDRGGPAWIRNKDGSYTNQSGVDIAEQSSIQNPKERQWPNKEREPFVETAPDNREPSIMPPGPGKRPASQSQFDAPYDSQSARGAGPEPVRQFRPDDLPRKELDIPDVKPSDLAKPRGDGNQYGNFEQVAGFRQGWSGMKSQFITDNNQAYRQGRDKTRQIAVDKQASLETSRQEVYWADGDPDKLDAIAKRLGVEPNKYASKTQEAILKKLNKLENDSGIRKGLEDDWDWENLRGIEEPETKRLSRLATEDGSGDRFRTERIDANSAITNRLYPQGFKPATGNSSGLPPKPEVPRFIQDRLDNALVDGKSPSKSRAQHITRRSSRTISEQEFNELNPDRFTNKDVSDKRTQMADAKIQHQRRTSSPELTPAERERFRSMSPEQKAELFAENGKRKRNNQDRKQR